MKRRYVSVIVTAITALLLSVLVAPTAQAAPVTASFVKVSDWGSGFEGKVTVTNGTTSAISTWSVALDFPSGYSVSSSWDAVRSSSGQTHTFTPPSWAGPLAPGASVTFGFNGNPGNFPGVAACRLNGASCSGGGGGTVPGAPAGLSGMSTSSSVTELVRRGPGRAARPRGRPRALPAPAPGPAGVQAPDRDGGAWSGEVVHVSAHQVGELTAVQRVPVGRPGHGATQ